MSEAESGIQQPSISQYAWVRICQFLAGLAWLAAGVVTAVDALDDAFPSPVTGLTLGGAVSLTGVCSVLWVGYRHQRAASLNASMIACRLSAVEAELGRTQSAITEALALLAVCLPVAPEGILARAQQRAAIGNGVPKLDQSAYWAVYSDVLRDLAGLGGDDPPTMAAN
jgi:hypothetical protein